MLFLSFFIHPSIHPYIYPSIKYYIAQVGTAINEVTTYASLDGLLCTFSTQLQTNGPSSSSGDVSELNFRPQKLFLTTGANITKSKSAFNINSYHDVVAYTGQSLFLYIFIHYFLLFFLACFA